MKNKKFLILLGCITPLYIYGCGSGEITSNERQKGIQAVSYDDEVDLYKLIPDPANYFSDTEIETITSEDGCFVYLDWVSKEEWDSYITKCKEGIWTREEYQSEYSWYVTSDDNLYKLSLDRYGDKNEYMSIVIEKMEEKKDEK